MAQNVTRRQMVRRTVMMWAVLAVVVAGLACLGGWENNNQGEFYDTVTGEVDWPYFARFFGVWFATVFVLGVFCSLGLSMVVRLSKRWFGRHRQTM